MNDPHANREEQRPPIRRRWLVLVVSLPLAVVAIAVAVLALGEYRCARAVTAEIKRLRAAGEPVDDETMARWFLAHTSQEGTAAWREILVAVEQVSSGEAVNALPYVGNIRLPENLVPGSDWPDEPRVAEFLHGVRPLIAQIEQAAKYPAPVWQPIVFDSFATLLPEVQTSRAVIRLLQLEVEHAVYHQDAERVLRGLAAMQAAAAAFDWDLCLVADLVGIALRGIHRDAIRRSLADITWEPAQWDQLFAQVARPRDVATRWHRSMAGERAMALAMLRGRRGLREEMLRGQHPSWDGPSALWLIPSGTLRYLDRMATIQQIGAEGVLGMADRVREFERDMPQTAMNPSDVLAALLVPAVSAAAAAHERDELNRRLTRTALGIKRYQSAQGHWPAKLSDLATVGLEAADWTALQAGPFGYRIEADGAVIWAYDLTDRQSPPRVRSEPEKHDAASQLWYVVRIR